MPLILVVCHDTGNTNVLRNTAESMRLHNPDLEIKFLITGAAANAIFSSAEQSHLHDSVIRLTDWVAEKEFSELNLRALTAPEKDVVRTHLTNLNPVSVITGCSCGRDALVPFQIAELLSTLPEVETNIIYNGDFFQDLTNNPFWVSLNAAWIEKVSLYVAFIAAVNQVAQINKTVSCTLAGSTALDGVLEAKEDARLVEQVRHGLNIADEQNMIFISGSKFIADDLELLDALATSLQDHPEIAVRMGMHPGTSDVPDYVGKLVQWLDAKKIENLRLVVKPSIAAKIGDALKHHTITAELSGDAIFSAASAVASSQPSTLPTQAIMKQLPAFCLDKYKSLSYLHPFFAQDSQALFEKPATKTALDKTRLGLPARCTVEIIEEALTLPLRAKR